MDFNGERMTSSQNEAELDPGIQELADLAGKMGEVGKDEAGNNETGTEISESMPDFDATHKTELGKESHEEDPQKQYKFEVEFSCMDYDLQKKFEEYGVNDEDYEAIIDKKYRHAYYSEQSDHIYFGEEAETRRAEDLSSECEKKYGAYLEQDRWVKDEVHRAIWATKEDLDSLILFGSANSIDETTFDLESGRKIYYQFRDRIIVDTADGFFQYAELRPNGDFRNSTNWYPELSKRAKADSQKYVNDQVDDQERYEKLAKSRDGLDDEVKEYIDNVRRNIYDVGLQSHEAVKSIEAINDEMIAGVYKDAIIDYEGGRLEIDNSESSVEDFYLSKGRNYERSFYKLNGSMYKERKEILALDNPSVYEEINKISNALEKLAQDDEMFQPIYDQIQTQLAKGEYNNATIDDYGVKLDHDIDFRRLSKYRMNKVVEEISDGFIHFKPDYDRSINRSDHFDFWYMHGNEDKIRDKRNALRKDDRELYVEIIRLEAKTENLIKGSNEAKILQAIITNDILNGNTERYRGIMSDNSHEKKAPTPDSLADFKQWW